MGEMQHSSALREYAIGITSQTLMASPKLQSKNSFANPFAFQLSSIPLWEALWSGYVSISSDLLATVPLLHFDQRATSWGPILRKQNV